MKSSSPNEMWMIHYATNMDRTHFSDKHEIFLLHSLEQAKQIAEERLAEWWDLNPNGIHYWKVHFQGDIWQPDQKEVYVYTKQKGHQKAS